MEKDKFERLCRRAGMEPADRVSTANGEILIADGFKGGKYRTMWVVNRGGLDVARDLEFAHDHNPELTLEDKKRARVNAARKDALAWAGLSLESGRYAS